MIRNLSIVAMATLAVACGPNKSYTINGSISDSTYNAATAYLYINGEKADSVAVENFAFTFSGEAETVQMATVRVEQPEKRRCSTGAILEPGVINVMIAGPREATVGGTPLNDAQAAYSAEIDAISEEQSAGYRALRENKELSDEERDSQIQALFDAVRAKRKAANEKCFNEHVNDVVGAAAMLSLSNYDVEKFDSLYQLAGVNVQNDYRVVKEKARTEAVKATSEGKMFTDFTIEKGNADGTPAKFSDYVGKGKYVLVDFWASWCGPCRREMPNLANVYKKYKGDKFEIVGVAVWDERADTEKALETLPITWPVMFDCQRIPTDIYGIYGIPEIILFGPDGTIVARGLRGEKIGEKIAEVMAQ